MGQDSTLLGPARLETQTASVCTSRTAVGSSAGESTRPATPPPIAGARAQVTPLLGHPGWALPRYVFACAQSLGWGWSHRGRRGQHTRLLLPPLLLPCCSLHLSNRPPAPKSLFSGSTRPRAGTRGDSGKSQLHKVGERGQSVQGTAPAPSSECPVDGDTRL